MTRLINSVAMVRPDKGEMECKGLVNGQGIEWVILA